MFSVRIRKVIAVFLLINFISNIVVPPFSYALTAGPTAPEATSFEPVDTTDLVDLKTGDFNYTIPLLEVPGPGGGYPLALSYHAGILPDQEASWTGLGFNVSPGAITRLVNGYADDHFDVKNNDRVFWEGGTATSASIGISYGFANAASVSANLTFANDTYKGRGVGISMGAGYGAEYGTSKFGGSASVNASVGISPYGDPFYSVGAGMQVGIGVAENEAKVGASMGISYNSLGGLQGYGEVGISKRGSGENDPSREVMGISMSTQGSKPQLSVAGATAGVYNGNQNKLSFDGDNFSIDIPIYAGLNVRLGRSYQRYWIDETASVSTFGSLYSSNVGLSQTIAYDNHDLLDIDLDLSEFSNPEQMLGGSFPDYDFYTVTGQGIGGNIRPYHYTQDLYRQNQQKAASIPLSENPTTKPQFRFVNDFSNRIEYEPSPIIREGDVLKHDFSGDRKTGPNENDGFANNQLAGSKHIQWFTNREIIQRTSGGNQDPYEQGFINTSKIERRDDVQVGGFTITKSDGVSYHYALPVYSFDEFSKSINKEMEGKNFNTLSKPEPYAYEWLLTAVTGPDFVDRNKNGLADHDDWGYWVNFEYDKWLDDYKWRNPGEGKHEDVDGQFEFYSFGKKQIYYLSKVMTQTHVAVFNKSERKDGREVMNQHNGGFDAIPSTHTDSQCLEDCLNACSDQTCKDNCYYSCSETTGWTYARPGLRLDNISLFRYNDYASEKQTTEYALRVIAFAYDYTLAQGTPNSYDNNNPTVKLGKLTLKSLDFKGKKGTSLLPPMVFSYQENPGYRKDGSDMWGYYKSDYQKSEATNFDHLTTISSAVNTDAWSLTEITTSLGALIKINYESDTYKRPLLYKSILTSIKNFELNTEDKTVKLNFADDIDFTAVTEILSTSSVQLLINKIYCNDKVTTFCQNDIQQIEKQLGTDLVSVEPHSLTIRNLYDQIVSVPQDDIYSYKEGALIAGHLLLEGETELPGGGLRVREVEYSDSQTNSGSATMYEYQQGTTSYEPIKLDKVSFEFGTIELKDDTKAKLRKAYLKRIHEGFSRLFFLSRYLPPPGILYKYVNVRERVKQNGIEEVLPNYTQYHFEVFNPEMIDYQLLPIKDEGTVQLANIKDLVKGLFESVIDIAYDWEDLEYRSRVLTRRVDFKDYSARIGNLKSVTVFGRDGKPVVETVNHFLEDRQGYAEDLAAKFKNQGVIEESFSRAKRILYAKEKTPYGYTSGNNFPFPFESLNDLDFQKLGLISKRVTYPSIQIGMSTKNYKTGVVTEKETIGFDYYSGEPIKVVTTDSYGNRYLSESLPAYAAVDADNSPAYAGMGLKIHDVKNKNMLTQTAGTFTYKVSAGDELQGLVSASVQTWSDQIKVLGSDGPQNNIYRMHAGYQWNGTKKLNPDGTYDLADFVAHPFNWRNLSQSPSWEKSGELTLYDVYSHVLEASDINGNFAATRMSNDFEKVIATAANASYNEFAASGAEYYAGNTDDDGGVDRGEGNPSAAHVHTGKYSLLVGFGSKGFNATLSQGKSDFNKKYKASVWVYAPGEAELQEHLDKVELYYTVNGVEQKAVHPVLQKNKSKSWYLLNLDIKPHDGTNTPQEVYVGVRNNSTRGVYFDDFRVCPLDASMATYVYNNTTGELAFILDANNFYTKFEYDAMGRLTRTSKELLNYDFGDGKESVRPDKIVGEVIYNIGKK